VVTYRSDHDTFTAMLTSLARALQIASEITAPGVTVYVVCNDETPDEIGRTRALVRRVRRLLPSCTTIEVIEGHRNVGYGAGQNLAIRRSRADAHLILNPDVVLDDHAILECLEHLHRHTGTVMVVPQGYDGAGRYARLAKRSPSILVLALRGLGFAPSAGPLGRRVAHYTYDDRLPSPVPQPVELASGCFMCCRTSALHAIGGFDERYFLYFEDYDLSRRIASFGQICEVPGVRIRHLGGRTSRRGWRRIRSFVRSAATYFRHYGWRVF
jgi:GT2 family glycosyltransferase